MKKSYLYLLAGIFFILVISSIQCGNLSSGGGCSCVPTTLPPNAVFISSYIKNVHLYPQCGRLIRISYNPLAVVIDFLAPINPTTLTSNTFTIIEASGGGVISGLGFSYSSFDSTNTQLTLWINTQQMANTNQAVYFIAYTGGLQTQSGLQLAGSNNTIIYGFEGVWPYGKPPIINSYMYGKEFGAVNGAGIFLAGTILSTINAFWNWLNGIPTTPRLVIPDAGYLNVPPHYPFTTNFSRTLYLPVEFVFEQKDSNGNFSPVDGSKYTGYNNIMLGNWINSFTSFLPVDQGWPGLKPFSYTVASARGLDIDTIYKLTYPTVQCSVPGGYTGNQDLTGNPLESSNYNAVDQVITFHTSSIRIDSPQSDNVNIPSVTKLNQITGETTSDVASVSITTTQIDPTTDNYELNKQNTLILLWPSSPLKKFLTINPIMFHFPGYKTIVTSAYDTNGVTVGTDFVTVNYQPPDATTTLSPVSCILGQINGQLQQTANSIRSVMGSQLDQIRDTRNGTPGLKERLMPAVNLTSATYGFVPAQFVWDSNYASGGRLHISGHGTISMSNADFTVYLGYNYPEFYNCGQIIPCSRIAVAYTPLWWDKVSYDANINIGFDLVPEVIQHTANVSVKNISISIDNQRLMTPLTNIFVPITSAIDGICSALGGAYSNCNSDLMDAFNNIGDDIKSQVLANMNDPTNGVSANVCNDLTIPYLTASNSIISNISGYINQCYCPNYNQNNIAMPPIPYPPYIDSIYFSNDNNTANYLNVHQADCPNVFSNYSSWYGGIRWSWATCNGGGMQGAVPPFLNIIIRPCLNNNNAYSCTQ
ncbi:MAG: hypothetical protein ACP5JP_08095 [bacterium]